MVFHCLTITDSPPAPAQGLAACVAAHEAMLNPPAPAQSLVATLQAIRDDIACLPTRDEFAALSTRDEIREDLLLLVCVDEISLFTVSSDDSKTTNGFAITMQHTRTTFSLSCVRVCPVKSFVNFGRFLRG